MARNKILTVVLASVILCVSGCSGGRLRNLISRNDYHSLEALDEQGDFYADSDDQAIASADKDSSRFVSDQRELDAPESAKEGRFSIARLLRGKSPEAGFGEDPFVEPIRTTFEDKLGQPTVKAVSAIKDDSFLAAERTASAMSASLEEVEKQAEDLFADMQDSVEDTAVNPFADAIAQVGSPEDLAAGTSHSFADFMARKAAESSEAAMDVAVESASTVTDRSSSVGFSEPAFEAPHATPPSEALVGGFDFDSLLDEPVAEVAEIWAAEISNSEFGADPIEMFAGKPGEAAAQPHFDFETPAADKSFDEVFVDSAAVTEDQDSHSEQDPFALASEKHGFKSLGGQDPWGAFEKTVTNREVAWGDNSVQKHNPEPDFAWGESSTPDFDDIKVTQGYQANGQQFQQVASTLTVEDAYPQESGSNDSGLVIPFDSGSVDQGAQFVELGAGNEVMDDPFFSDSNELAEVPDGLELAAETEATGSGNTGGPATILGWPTRTWFFILGCVILAILLFLPNRQKQNN